MSIVELKSFKIVPDIIHEYSAQIKEQQIPLIIDNGLCKQCPVILLNE